MTNIVEKIKSEIAQDYYKQNFPNDGQRFVAWYLRNIYLLDQLQAKDAITDGANDKQIDAVFIDEEEQKIHIIQGKFYTGDSIGAEPIREVVSAWSQFDQLDKLQESANEKLKKKICEISSALEDDSYCICFELITTSTFSEDANKDIEIFQSKLMESEDDDTNAQFEVVDKQGIEDKYNMVLEQANPSLNHTIVLETGKYLMTDLSNTKVLLAAVPLKECIRMPGIKDGALFQKNVRQSLGINNTWINKLVSYIIFIM